MDTELEVHEDEQVTQPFDTQIIRRSGRAHQDPVRYGFLIRGSNEYDEPTSYEEVLKSSESDRWLEAMKS